MSIQADLLEAITRRAKRLYDGNISAVIAEMGADVKRLEALDRYVETHRIAPLTEAARARIEAELRGAAGPEVGRTAKKRPASKRLGEPSPRRSA